jgi:hypothetical protein
LPSRKAEQGCMPPATPGSAANNSAVKTSLKKRPGNLMPSLL